MKLVYINPNPSGAYPPIQEGNYNSVPEGMAVWPDTLPTDDFYAYNGFVTLTVQTVDEVETVTGYTPNVEAWEVWKSTLPPEPEPEAGDTDVLNTLLGVTTE